MVHKGTMEVSIFNLNLYLQHLTSITWIVSLSGKAGDLDNPIIISAQLYNFLRV